MAFLTHLLDTKPALDNLLVIVLLERVLFSEVLNSADVLCPLCRAPNEFLIDIQSVHMAGGTDDIGQSEREKPWPTTEVNHALSWLDICGCQNHCLLRAPLEHLLVARQAIFLYMLPVFLVVISSHSHGKDSGGNLNDNSREDRMCK